MYRSIEELRSMAVSMKMPLEELLYKMLTSAVDTIMEAQEYNRDIVKLYKDEVGFVKSNAETNLIILQDEDMLRTLREFYND